MKSIFDACRKNLAKDENADVMIFLIAGFAVGALVGLFVPPAICLILTAGAILALFIDAFNEYKLPIASFLGAMIFVTIIKLYIWKTALMG